MIGFLKYQFILFASFVVTTAWAQDPNSCDVPHKTAQTSCVDRQLVLKQDEKAIQKSFNLDPQLSELNGQQLNKQTNDSLISCRAAVQVCLKLCDPKSANYHDCSKGELSKKLAEFEARLKTSGSSAIVTDNSKSKGAQGSTLTLNPGLPSTLSERSGFNPRPDSLDYKNDEEAKKGPGARIELKVPFGAPASSPSAR